MTGDRIVAAYQRGRMGRPQAVFQLRHVTGCSDYEASLLPAGHHDEPTQDELEGGDRMTPGSSWQYTPGSAWN